MTVQQRAGMRPFMPARTSQRGRLTPLILFASGDAPRPPALDDSYMNCIESDTTSELRRNKPTFKYSLNVQMK
jgi:hypothetical protein